jgi:hypothetical protein
MRVLSGIRKMAYSNSNGRCLEGVISRQFSSIYTNGSFGAVSRHRTRLNVRFHQ